MKQRLLNKINDELINAKTSPLYDYRSSNDYLPVAGEGSCDAALFFIGEAPGKNEAMTGKPFCGRAGSILDSYLAKFLIRREDVYISNIVKDRPPDNRDPLPEEISFYAPFLDRQIEIIKPRVLVPLGRFSGNYLLKKYNILLRDEPMLSLHGKVFEHKEGWGLIRIVPLVHPASLIYDRKKEKLFEEGFIVIENLL